MAKRLRSRFWVPTVLASTTTVLAAITLISQEWIEFLFGVDPDGGSGTLEWAIVTALGTCSVAFGLLARTEWKHASADRRAQPNV
jgi:hypothetical protein